MRRLLILASMILVLPACILAVKVEDNAFDRDHHDDQPGHETGRSADTAVDQDTPEEPPYVPTVTVHADPETLVAGTTELVLLTITGDITGPTVTGLAFDLPLITDDWRLLGDGSVAVSVSAPADALGPIGLTLADDVLGRVHLEAAITVTAAAPHEGPPADCEE